MYYLLPPEMALQLHHDRLREFDRRAELWRQLECTPPPRPNGLADQLLLATGGYLIALGQWLRRRAVTQLPA